MTLSRQLICIENLEGMKEKAHLAFREVQSKGVHFKYQPQKMRTENANAYERVVRSDRFHGKGKIKSNPEQGVYVQGIARRLSHDLAEYDELVKLYEDCVVKDIRDQRNKVMPGLLIFQAALTIKELEMLEAGHIDLKEGKIRIVGTDRTNERILKLQASKVFELQEYVNMTRARILSGPKVNGPGKITQLIIGIEGGRALSGEVAWLMRR